MADAKALERLKATRRGNRGVVTKLTRSVDELLDEEVDSTIDLSRCETIQELLETKLNLLNALDEEILTLIEVEEIEKEIDEASEITERIITTKKKLGIYIAKAQSKPLEDTTTDASNTLNEAKEDANTTKTHITNTIPNTENATSENSTIHLAGTSGTSTANPTIHSTGTSSTSTADPTIHSTGTSSTSTADPTIHSTGTSSTSTADPTIHSTGTSSTSTADPTIHSTSTSSTSTADPTIHSTGTSSTSTADPTIHSTGTSSTSTADPTIHSTGTSSTSTADSTIQQRKNNTTTNALNFSPTKYHVQPKLPKITLSRFKGEVTRWNTFWDSFESTIHNNTGMSNIDKFNYLNSLILEGTASRAIQGLPITNDNYEHAIEILQERFGRPQQIISAHMDEILKIPSANGDRTAPLRFVYDKVSAHVRGLASLGVSENQYGSLLIPIIMSKLPAEIRLQIARKSTNKVWGMEEILTTIKTEIEAREVSEATSISNNNPRMSTTTHANISSTTAANPCKGTVLLQTVRAVARNGTRTTPVRILFDTGSQRSYVTSSVIAQLKLKPTDKETLHLNTFGDSKYKKQQCEVYNLSILIKNGTKGAELTAIKFPTICSPLNSKVNINYAHLDDLELADYNSCDNRDGIDILIGADQYWNFVTGDIVRGDEGPTAISSKLGWLLSGCLESSGDENRHTVTNLILAGESFDNSVTEADNDILNNSLKRFWDVETIGIATIEEKNQEKLNFIQDIRFKGDRYEVGLPWTEDRRDIEPDYELCHNRLRSLHSKLRKQPELLQQYDRNIQEQLASGIIERVPVRKGVDSKDSTHDVIDDKHTLNNNEFSTFLLARGMKQLMIIRPMIFIIYRITELFARTNQLLN